MPTEAPEKDTYNPARNPGDTDWNERFNDLARHETEGNFNDITSGLGDVDQQGNELINDNDAFNDITGNLDDVNKKGNKIINDNADEPESRRKKLQDSEESPVSNFVSKVGGGSKAGNDSPWAKLTGFLKSRKSSSSVTGILVGGSLMFATVIGSPAALFATVVSQVTNELNFASDASHVRGLKMLSHRIAGSKDSEKVKQACADPKSIKCKSVTTSEAQVKEMDTANIEVVANGKDVAQEIADAAADPPKPVDPEIKVGDDRYVVDELKVPTGDLDQDGKMIKESIKAGDDIETVLRNKPKLRTMLFKGFNPLTKTFFASHFNDILQKSFKTDRGDKLTGDDEKSERQSMREALDIQGVEGDENGRMSDEDREKVGESKVAQLRSSLGKLNQKISNAAGAVCTGINVARTITAAAKAKQIVEMTRLFVVYASEMHRVMDGTSQPQHSNFIGNNMNYSEYNPTDSSGGTNRFYNTTMTDAEGMKMLLHGDIVDLLPWSRKYIVGGSEAIHQIDNFIQMIYENVPGGKSTVKEACRYASSLASCFGPQAAACAAMYGAFTLLAPLISKAAEPYLKQVIDNLAHLDIDDDTKGVDLGNIFAAGAGLALGRMAQEVGLRPSTVATMRQYRLATADSHEQIAMMYRDQAKATPFDVTNQYSFMGTLAKDIYSRGGVAASAFGNLSRMFAIVPASIDTFVKGSSAKASWVMQQNDFEAAQWQKCPDQALSNIKADGSIYCTPGFDMSDNALTMDIDNNQKFMIDGGYANADSGEPTGQATPDGSGSGGALDTATGGASSAGSTSNKKGHKFAMYIKYCSQRDQNSEGPYGDTMAPIENGNDDDEKWRNGYYCLNASDQAKAASVTTSTNTTVSLIPTTTSHQNAQLTAAGDSDAPTQEELDNFATFTMDYGPSGSTTVMDEGAKETPKASGDCSQLAQQLLDNKDNVDFQTPQQRTYMEQTAKDCTQTLDCGGSVQMSTKLLQLLVTASQSYKITIGAQAAGHECDGGYHPKGQAVDINGVRKPDQPMERATTWSAEDRPIFKEFYEFLDQNSDVQLELGQMTETCWQGSPMPTLHNTKPVPDACNHIHVGVTSP